MTEIPNPKQYDLEDRTREFALNVRSFVKNLSKNIQNFEDGKQLVRSSGSVGANYIEANESISKKDFIHRIRISRKESKESRYWLNLVDIDKDHSNFSEKGKLVQEAGELMKIFSAIMRKSQV